nr:EAL domain-containing protein [Asticcacaulis currens]
MHALRSVGEEANSVEEARSVELTRGAVGAAVRAVASVTLDNAQWDEAYTQTQRDLLDDAWIDQTWGIVSASGDNYDAVFLVDEQRRIVRGYVQGQRVSPSGSGTISLPPDWVSRELGATPPGGEVSGVVSLLGRPAVAAISLIHPVKREAAQVGRRRYLMFVRFLTPQLLRQYTDLFSLTNVRIATDSARSPSLPLKDIRRRTIGYVEWVARKPGAEAVSAAQPGITTGFIAMVVVSLGLLSGILIALRVVGEKHRRIQTLALTDTLSGLPNRAAFLQSLGSLLNTKAPVTVVMIDLDGFKEVNDTFGHDVGDQLIVAVSRILLSHCPSHSHLARLGGDEFAVALPIQGRALDVDACLNSVIATLKAPLVVNQHVVQVGASCGIAVSQPPHFSTAELMRRADVAMYAAKSAGKGQMVTYSVELDAERQVVATLTEEMRSGLINDEFEVFYQGIFNSRTQTYSGVEALLRWTRRPAGALSPSVFIPVAEQSGLIHELGLFVLRRAISDWVDYPDVYVSVNISPSQFSDFAFETNVLSILEQMDFPAERLELEVTEGYLIDRPERAKAAIETFQSAGVRMVLDDFGTGFTSIAYLQAYGFNKIKLDKSLIDDLVTSKKSAVLVQGVMFLANGLAMEITAEGVETEGQAKLLELAGCRLMQGYLYSKPAPAAEMKAQLSQTPSAAKTGTG